MSLEKRLDRLENYCPKQRTVEDMTDNELAELVMPGTKFDDLTDEYLQAVVRGEQEWRYRPCLAWKRQCTIYN